MSKTVSQDLAANEKESSDLQLRCGFSIPLGRTTDFSLASGSTEDHHLRDCYMKLITGEGSEFYQQELELESTALRYSVVTFRWSHFTRGGADAASDSSWTDDRLTVLWAALFDLANTSDWAARYWETLGVYHFRAVSDDADHAFVFEAFTEQIVDILALPCLYDGDMDLRAAWGAATDKEREEFLLSIDAVRFNHLAELMPERWAELGSADVDRVIEATKAARPIATAANVGLNSNEKGQPSVEAVNEMIVHAQNRKLSTEEKKGLVALLQQRVSGGASLWFLHDGRYVQCRILTKKRSDSNTFSIIIRKAGKRQERLFQRANLPDGKASLILNTGEDPNHLTAAPRGRYGRATHQPT